MHVRRLTYRPSISLHTSNRLRTLRGFFCQRQNALIGFFVLTTSSAPIFPSPRVLEFRSSLPPALRIPTTQRRSSRSLWTSWTSFLARRRFCVQNLLSPVYSPPEWNALRQRHTWRLRKTRIYKILVQLTSAAMPETWSLDFVACILSRNLSSTTTTLQTMRCAILDVTFQKPRDWWDERKEKRHRDKTSLEVLGMSF